MNKDKSGQQREVHVPSKNYTCPTHGGSFEKNQECLVCSPQSQTTIGIDKGSPDGDCSVTTLRCECGRGHIIDIKQSAQQSQQGLVENYNCYLGLCYCSQPCLYKPPTEDESEAEVESEILKQLLIKQAQKTRKETLEEVVEKFGRYNDGCGCCMDQKLEESIQSLINNQ